MLNHPRNTFLYDAQNFNDRSKNGFTGTNTGGATNTGGVVGSRTYFSALNGQHVRFGNVLNYERTDSFSLAAWMRVPSYNVNGWTGINAFGKMSSGGSTGYAITIFAGQYGLELDFYVASATVTLQAYTYSFTTGNVWYHVVCTYNGTSANTGITIYINGISAVAGRAGGPLTTTIIGTQQFHVGSADKYYPIITPTNNFSLDIDEAMVFDFVLNPQDAKRVMYGLHPLNRS